MTRQDMLKVLAVLKTAYPYFYKDTTRQSAEDTLELWASLFAEDDPALVGMAVKSFIASDARGYPPVPGQIKALMRLLTIERHENELKAWGLVRRAIENARYNAKAEFAKLPPLVQKTVGNAAQLRAWSSIGPEAVDVTLANSFMRSYREEVQYERETAALPPDAKALLEQTVRRASVGLPMEGLRIEGATKP